MPLNVIGHRGEGRTKNTPFANGKAPESSLQSFRDAIIKDGADGIEFDIFLSRDAVPIVVDFDQIEGHVISELSANDIRKIRLSQNQKIPLLDEVLENMAEIQSQMRNKSLVLNVELKGLSVVEPTLNAIAAAVSRHGLQKESIRFSSFDWDKLSLVRELDEDAHIQPTIGSPQIFFDHDIEMPGYHINCKTAYNRVALKEIENYVREKRCLAIDIPTCDIRPELIERMGNLGVGFCSYPSGPRRIENAEHLHKNIELLSIFAKHANHTCLKVDDIQIARDIIEHPQMSEISVAKLERIMGMRFIEAPNV